MPDHGLGRKPFVFDSRDYPVSKLKAMLAAKTAVPLKWYVPRILDQGDNGTCVSAGILGALDCDDEHHVDPGLTSADIIPFFKTIPGAGPLPDGGAQVRDGLKAAAKRWGITYALLLTKEQIVDWYEHHGPVVFGSDFLSGMGQPDARGFVTVSGAVEGGHCYYGNGDVGGMDFVNSWGVWADGGHFYMTAANFDKLMARDFEAWAIVQQAPKPPTPPDPTPDVNEFAKLVAALKAACEAILKWLEGPA